MLTYSTVMKRYRGENSLLDDIAARFDKHLEEPVHIRLTARADVTKLSPGRYQLCTILMSMTTNWKHMGHPRYGGGRKKRDTP